MALVFVALPYVLKHAGVVPTVTDGIYLVTGIAVVLYTVETFYLRREMVRQNELMVQPLLITRIERPDADDHGGQRRDRLMLRNIGRGPGLFVRVPDVEITEAAGVRFTAGCEVVDVIEAGETVIAPIHVWTDVPEAPEEAPRRRFKFVSNLNPKYANATQEIRVEYQDVSGQRHESVMQMGKDGIRLVRHGRSSRRE